MNFSKPQAYLTANEELITDISVFMKKYVDIFHAKMEDLFGDRTFIHSFRILNLQFIEPQDDKSLFTYLMQPIDVYVNGPLKARVRQHWQDYI